MKQLSLRTSLFLFAGLACLFIIAGCESTAVSDQPNAAMSEKQKAVIKKHHEE